MGARYLDSKIGSCKYSHLTVFSFHPVKLITTGEGGMVLTNERDLPERLKLLRSHGITRDPEGPTGEEGPWYYEQVDQRLGESEYIGSDRYTAADITAQCAIDFANAVGLPTPEACTNIARWHKTVSARPSAAA